MPNRFADFKVRQRPSTSARAFPSGASEFLLRYRDEGEARLAQPFTGITANGVLAPGLFKVERTGVPTRPLRDAAAQFTRSPALCWSPEEAGAARAPRGPPHSPTAPPSTGEGDLWGDLSAVGQVTGSLFRAARFPHPPPLPEGRGLAHPPPARGRERGSPSERISFEEPGSGSG